MTAAAAGGFALDEVDDTWMDSGESGEEEEEEEAAQEEEEEEATKKGKKKVEKKVEKEDTSIPKVERCGKWELDLVEKLRENLMRWGAMRWRLGFLQMKKDRFVTGVLILVVVVLHFNLNYSIYLFFE